MNFDVTDEQQSIRDMVKSFTRDVIAPIAEEIDHENRFPIEHISKMGEQIGRAHV